MSYSEDTSAFKDQLRACGAKESSLPFAVAAVDPFHNSEIDVVGAPDHQTGRSFVYRVSKEITISAPAGVTEAWDAHVAMIPYLWDTDSAMHAGQVGVPKSDAVKQVTNHDHGLAYLENIVNVSSVFNGLPTFTPGASSNQLMQGVSIGEYLNSEGASRIVSAGFQVQNTTAELHKQGACTVYEQSNNDDVQELWAAYNASEVFQNKHMAHVVQLPPGSLENAKELQGRTWEAAEGAYCVAKIDHQDNPPKRMGPHSVIAMRSDTDNAFVGVDPAFFDSAEATPLGMDLPYRQTGAYFSGLSPETVLTISVVVHLEYFPFPGTSLVALAHNSLPADPQVIECLDMIQRDMPAGVEVKFNPTGRFFKRALSILRTGGKFLAKQGDPRLKSLGNAVTSGFAAADEVGKVIQSTKKSRRKSRKSKTK